VVAHIPRCSALKSNQPNHSARGSGDQVGFQKPLRERQITNLTNLTTLLFILDILNVISPAGGGTVHGVVLAGGPVVWRHAVGVYEQPPFWLVGWL
jgi:hypothetical protein